MRLLRSELGLLAGGMTTAFFLTLGNAWLYDLSDSLRSGLLFFWLFTVMLWAAVAVARHADALAIKLGEPMGTLILALAVQTVSHKEYFRTPAGADSTDEHAGHDGIVVRSVPFQAVLLVAYMSPIVLLSKSMAKLIDHGINVVGAPAALGGLRMTFDGR